MHTSVTTRRTLGERAETILSERGSQGFLIRRFKDVVSAKAQMRPLASNENPHPSSATTSPPSDAHSRPEADPPARKTHNRAGKDSGAGKDSVWQTPLRRLNQPEGLQVQFLSDGRINPLESATQRNDAHDGVVTSAHISGHGAIVNEISHRLLGLMASMNVHQARLQKINMYEQSILPHEQLPLQFRVLHPQHPLMRETFMDLATGSQPIHQPWLDMMYVPEGRQSRVVSHEQVEYLGLLDIQTCRELSQLSLRMYDMIQGYAMAHGVGLLSLKLEYGFDGEESFQLMLVSELTPAQCVFVPLGFMDVHDMSWANSPRETSLMDTASLMDVPSSIKLRGSIDPWDPEYAAYCQRVLAILGPNAGM